MNDDPTAYGYEDVVGAIRLAIEASANEKTLEAMVIALVARARPTPRTNTGATALLVEAAQNMGATFSVAD